MKLSVKKVKTVLAAGISISMVALVLAFQTSSQASSAAAGDGAETFKTKCASCHGADGSGNTAVGKAMKIKNLGSAEVQSQTDEQLLTIISNGKGKMPAYGKSLGADKCKELVAYIRTLKK